MNFPAVHRIGNAIYYARIVSTWQSIARGTPHAAAKQLLTYTHNSYMKLHLPKMLLTAVVAAAACSFQHAKAETLVDYSVYAGSDINIQQWKGGAHSDANKKYSVCYGLWYSAKYDNATQSLQKGNSVGTAGSSTGYTSYIQGSQYLMLDADSANYSGRAYFDATMAVAGIIVTENSAVSTVSGNLNVNSLSSSVDANRTITLGKTGTTAESPTYTVIASDFKLSNADSQQTNNTKFTLQGHQQWEVASGKKFTLQTIAGNAITNTGTLTIKGDGTVEFLNTLNNTGTLTINSGTLAINNAITGANGSLVFGEGVKLSYTGKVSSTSALQHGTYGFKSNRTVDLLDGNTTNREVTVLYNGSTYTMATDGTIAALADNTYYIEGNVSASTIKGNDDLSTASDYQLKTGTFTLDEDFTLSGNSAITGTTIKNHDNYTTAKLIIGSGTTTVNSTGQKLQSNIEIASGATLQFLGTGADAINYGQTNREINVYGTMDVGTTRQTVGNWTFNLKGGTIQGAGQPSQSNIGLDVHAKGYINALALDGATAAAPTVSTISTKVRYNGALNINVEENARLDMTGAIIAGNKLTKSGSGTLRLANNDNNYADKAFDVTGGTLELHDNAVTMNGAVKVNNGAKLAIVNTDNNDSTYTLANVTLDNGSLLTQGTTSAYTTTLTNLSVGAGGGTIGTDYGIAVVDVNIGKRSISKCLSADLS